MKQALAILSLFGSIAFVSALTFPEPTGYIVDQANILSLEARQALEGELTAYTASTSNEIAVVTVSSLEGVTIEEYAVKLFEKWSIGTKDKDNGVLLLIAPNERELRIEVGYGLEGAVPDITAKDIITTVITPSFKDGNYDVGVTEGVRALIKATEGEYVAQSNGAKGSSNSVEAILFFLFFGFQFLAAILGRSKSWWAGGLLGGILGLGSTYLGAFGLTLISGGLVTFLLIVLGLIFDYFVSSSYSQAKARGGSIPWWIGGGSGRGSSGGFGGFSGGSSGGGGASGRW